MIRRMLALLCLLVLPAVGGCASALTRDQLATATDDQLADAWRSVGATRAGDLGSGKTGEWSSALEYRKAIRAEALGPARMPTMPAEQRRIIESEQVEIDMPRTWVWWMWGPPYQKSKQSSPYGDLERWEWSGYPTYREVTFRDGKVLWWSDTARR